MSIETYAKYWAENYKEDLTHNIMPFWLKNGLDKEHGGIYTCVARNGQLIDTTKSVWFQGRFAFICSYAYNNIEKNNESLGRDELYQKALNILDENKIDVNSNKKENNKLNINDIENLIEQIENRILKNYRKK